MKISILKNPATKYSSYVVIPFLESSYKKYGKSVFKMINHGYVMLNDKYKDACSAIDAKLQDNDNKRIIKPDAKLTALLKYDPKTMPIDPETNQPSPLYYYYLQKLLTRHFPESVSKK